MLTRSRLYQRIAPDKDAKLFLIFCEGTVTEPNYFNYFNELNSRIRIIAVPADDQKDNTPMGLFQAAKKAIIKSENNSSPEYDLTENDEVWFVIDTDQWGEKIDELRNSAKDKNWQIAQSNPCFEVWLYFHFNKVAPAFIGHEASSNWKKNLNEIIKGGFDYRKHPIFIKEAIDNATKNYEIISKPSSTEVYLLANKLLPLIENEINEAFAKKDAH
jgi:hypothetical protein